jgi:hypothetical protein
MAAHAFAIGDLELARKFYVRAIEHDPRDTVAMGYLACVLARAGRWEEAQSFHRRAGPGEWSACADPTIVVPPASGRVPPQ